MSSEGRTKEVEKIIRADDQWEPIGATPMPDFATLRNWDRRLLQTYKPWYAPFCDLCCFCTYGKCDLTEGKRGACGIDIATQQARVVLLACCMGMSAHAGHGRHIIDYLIERHGEDCRIDLGEDVVVEAPNIRTVVGLKPETLGDLRTAIEYVERELIHAISSLHTGQEGSALDYESKALHIGMLDHVAMEAADVAQIVGFKYPTSKADTDLVAQGWGTIDTNKAVVTVIGHNPATSTNIIDYLQKENLYDKVEVCGICCTALETTRYSSQAKVIGPLSRQLFFERTGISDVIVTDEQCIRTDTPIEAKKVGTALIATSDKACYGLEDVTEKSADEIVKMIIEEGKQVLILDHEKAGEVASKVAIQISPTRKMNLITEDEAKEAAKKCNNCGFCERVCPNLISIGSGMKAASEGDFGPLKILFNQCIGCGKCEQECPRNVPIFQVMQMAASKESYNVRAGRGPIMDTEIRRVGAPIVLGTIPGIIAFVGCSNYPDIDDIVEMAEEFARRKYIVVMSGCAAMVAGTKLDEDGKSLYDRYPGDFDAGCVVNVGSCVANAHITGAAMKVANIFATIPLRGNYEVIADYTLNRVGAVGVAWGAYSQKAASIATGCNRLGVPVLLGPHSAKYRRLFISRKGEDDWTVMDGRTQQMVNTEEPSPEHLITVTESKESAMVTIARLCIRKNDTPQGRGVKLNHYISLWKKYMGGGLPDDLHLYVRRAADIPLVYKKEAMSYLKEIGWKEKPTLSLPTLIGTYPSKVPLEAVIH
ncbi:MAG: CO dehydrogenase/acetyl-CoA synthase complex subunit alpha [Chloroflexota bacterium]|nr:CO dehydrogenase/acetyl-CoA synthase complex subunit alpha [Chloroflexota bacterium]